MTGRSLINQALKEIAAGYHPGTLPWTKTDRPDQWEKMLTLEQRVNKMASGSDMEGLKKVLGEYRELILSNVNEFRNRGEERAQGLLGFVGPQDD